MADRSKAPLDGRRENSQSRNDQLIPESQSLQVSATSIPVYTGASSGFALPTTKPFNVGALGPINPFSPTVSPAASPEATPQGTPITEMQKFNLGVERYARAIEDPGLSGSFSGTVPLPSLSPAHHTASKRRPSNGLVEPLTDIETGAAGGTVDGGDPATDGLGGKLNFRSLKRAISGRIHTDADDLESNIKQVHRSDVKIPLESDISNSQHEEKGSPVPADEGPRRRKPKGGILSQLLKLQRNEAVAAAAATSGSGEKSSLDRASSTAKQSAVKKTKKGFYYRSMSRNNSATSLKEMISPSVTTTPKASPRATPRNSTDKKRGHYHEDLAKNAESRTIHRDIAEILTRQSFLIMMAKSLILYGAPSHRIEETCMLLAQKMEMDASFALLPGLMTISFSDPETHTSDTRHLRCSQGMDMQKLATVHKIALAVLRGESIEKANRDLEQVTLEPPCFPLWLTLLGWLGSSAFVAPLAFGGGWYDMALAGFCGLLVGMLGVVAGKFPVYGNVFEITASILVGFIAKAFGDRVCFSAVALAGVVVLLPGLLLTQAIMELASRNVVSGAVRMFYALMYAFFLGFGLTLGAELWDYISGGATVASASACQNAIDRWWYFLIYPAVSASINIVFNAHPRQWFGMTFVTAIGLVVTLFLKSGPQITAAIAAFAVGMTGQLYGRLTGQLSYVPLLSGVLLLVPGSVGVRGILAIIGSDPSQGFTFVLTMIHVSVAITLGVFCSVLVCYAFWRKSTFMSF
ncbi:hypothetical protein BGZ72_002163 [Mortierella alpina]|nr:hypothetical protein BGZ72_002163 [Mortierella alpina]